MGLVPEADEQANEDIETEIREELEKMMPPLPYLERVEKNHSARLMIKDTTYKPFFPFQ